MLGLHKQTMEHMPKAPDKEAGEIEALIQQYIELDEIRRNIFSSFVAYKLTGDTAQLTTATTFTQILDRALQEPTHFGVKTRPIGLYHSAGSGFNVMPRETIEAVASRLPSTSLYGYLKLAPQTAKFSAQTFLYLHEQRQRMRQQELGLRGNLSLDMLVKQAYIPIPDLIEGMPVIGPIELNEKVHSLFLSWVKGPTLHEQLPGINEEAKERGQTGKAYSRFRDMRLWIVSQMTGVWQASPSPLANGTAPEDLEQRMRQYYKEMVVSSMVGYSTLLNGIELSPDKIRKMSTAVEYVIAQLPIDSGNTGRYFDAALRNFIDEVGNVYGTYADAYHLAVIGGQINFSKLWDLTRRIDFSHVAGKPFCVFEEDTAHITENWLAGIETRDRIRYNAGTMLTRQSLLAYNSGRIGEAAEIAGYLESLRTGQSKPEDAKPWRSYYQTYERTIETMPWVRKIRQGYLALLYAAKARADQEMNGENVSRIIEGLLEESSAYLLKSSLEMPKVVSLAGIKKTDPVNEGVQVMQELLTAAHEQANIGNINEGRMIETGTKMLKTYV